jgi:HSP20 family protein
MTATATKVPVTTEKKTAEPVSMEAWRPFETLKKEIDHLFDDFGRNVWGSPFRALADFEPFWSSKLAAAPAVDIAEGDKAYEVTAELPGMDEKNIEVKVVNGGLTIKGEKKDEKEEKKKDYYLSERRYGSFERYFRLPDSVDADKIEASFKKGVLTVTIPKKAEAQKPAKKIEVKAAA